MAATLSRPNETAAWDYDGARLTPDGGGIVIVRVSPRPPCTKTYSAEILRDAVAKVQAPRERGLPHYAPGVVERWVKTLAAYERLVRERNVKQREAEAAADAQRESPPKPAPARPPRLAAPPRPARQGVVPVAGPPAATAAPAGPASAAPTQPEKKKPGPKPGSTRKRKAAAHPAP